MGRVATRGGGRGGILCGDKRCLSQLIASGLPRSTHYCRKRETPWVTPLKRCFMEKGNTKKRETIDWRPEWSGEDLKHYEAVKAALLEDGSVIRSLRVRLDLSQAALADLLGTTQSNVSKIEAKGDPRL